MLLDARVAAEKLSYRLHKDALGCRQNALHRDAGVVETIFATDQIVVHERAIDPGQHVVVHRVYLPKGASEFTHLGHKPGWQRRQCYVSLLQIHAFFSEGQEEVSARVWVDNGLNTELRFMHL